jgi:small membrane protein
MEIIQIIILAFTLFALSRVLVNIKDRAFSALEGTFWIVFWSLAVMITISPSLIEYVSILVGVKRGIDLVIYLTIIILSYLIFRLYVLFNRQNENITKIVRRIAINKEIKK